MAQQEQSVQPSAASPRRLQHDDYTVAIICPMGVELTPVLALLDEEHETLSTGRDQNAYMLGRMGRHNVVVAVMPSIGNNPAAMVAAQLLNDFGRVRFGLLVGIGGGIPDRDYDDEDLHDIRLGDVVVSKAQDGFGGVVQFDHGKSTVAGFVKTGHLNGPPHVLASNMELLRAQHNRRGNRISQYLDEMLNKNPYMEDEYSYPGAVRDRLFQAEYPHGGGVSCKGCDVTKIIERKARRRLEPRIHYGTIGSSNMVIKDTKKRDELRDSMKILCVEMEAAGLIEAFPCLVIRGICDYADSHKNKTWQPYAAATAAAYAKELLLQIPPEAVKQTQTIADALEGLYTKMEQVHENTQKTEKRTMSAEEDKVLEWLSPTDVDVSALYNKSREVHTAGTGQWLLDDPRYKGWRDGKPGLLWLHGVAGCGKTVLCSTAIYDLKRHVAASPGRYLAYWYFRFDNRNSQDVSKMLRSLLRQSSISPLPTAILAMYDRHRKAASDPSVEELTTALDSTLSALDEDVYIVFDALDECPHADRNGQRELLLRCIKGLMSRTHSKLYLLVTSRPEPDIQTEVGRIATYSFDIEKLIRGDVEKYVETKLQGQELASWGEDEKKSIRRRLFSFEERRFRWVELLIRRFAQCASSNQLRDALEHIPKDLEGLYQQTFDSIDALERDEVAKIMQWLAMSLQPLTAEQVATVAGFRAPDFVVRRCTSLLVTIIHENTSEVIKLAHFSVKEFIIIRLHEETSRQWYQFSSELAHKDVAITALEALLDPEGRLRPILYYAARHWPQHAIEGLKEDSDKKLEKQIDHLFDPNHTSHFEGWLEIYDPDNSYRGHTVGRKGEPLYYASLLGFQRAVYHLWVNGSQLSEYRGQHGNALNAAAINGHVGILHWIIQKSKDPTRYINLVGIVRQVERNAEQTIAVLLSTMSDSQVTDDVVVAAAGNQGSGLEVMELLLAKKGDQIQVTDDVVKATAGNVRSGRQVMELLLAKKGGQIQVTDDVVKAAAGNERSGRQVMELLLAKKGDQIQVTDDVVKAAAGNRHSGLEVMELLLAKKGDQIQVTDDVVKAAAGNQGSGLEVMELLLAKKGDQKAACEFR